MSQPHAEYSQRLEARLQTVAAKDALHKRIGNAKLAIVVATCVLLWLSLKAEVISIDWLLLPIVIYAGLALAHEFVREGQGCVNHDGKREPVRGNHFIFQREPEEDERRNDAGELGVADAFVLGVFGGDGLLASLETLGIFGVWLRQTLPPATLTSLLPRRAQPNSRETESSGKSAP